MKLWRSIALLALGLAVGCSGPTTHTPLPGSASASTPVVAEPPLPIDARITKGTLESGLTYYVLPNKRPEKRAQMWLVVNAGSVLEDDDQRGLAHLCEHLAFQGTKRFPKQDIVSFMEKSGMRFGADLNASTSFDETIYMLQVPTDQADQIDTSLKILRDWSEAVTFDPEALDHERGVVLEEWRLGRGAGMRMFDKQAPVVLGPRYGERITIGKPEIIEKASRDTLMRFYKDWYRPDLMAVVAVGDFDAADVESKIKAEFGSQKRPESPRARPVVEVPKSTEPRVSIETDPELTSTDVTILSELPHRPQVTEKDYRRGLAEQIYGIMLNARLDELLRDADAPFLAASVSTPAIVRTADAFTLHATVKEDGALRGASALLEEVLRVERHGFTQTELDRARTNMLRFYEQAVVERTKAGSTTLAREIVRNFLQAEAMPGIEAELELAKKLLPTLELAELNQLAQTFADGSRVIAVSGPPSMVKPTTAAVLALAKDVASHDIGAYVDDVPTEPLMAEAPKKGSVTGEKKIAELGITEWTLSNGIRVVVKPTDFANDEIRMGAFAPGGTSVASDADYDSARFGTTLAGLGGIGPYSAPQLRKAMSGKLVGVSAFIDELEQGVEGHSTRADLPTMMQLTHLAFTAPRRDDKAIAAWQKRQIALMLDAALSPTRVFNDEMLLFERQNHPRRQPATADTFATIDVDKAFAFYRDRFSDASGFTFVFVGSIDLDALKGLAEVYLASLPATKRGEKWKDLKVAYPAGAHTKVVERGTEPKATVEMIFKGAEPWSRDAENDMAMLTDTLRRRLLVVLRQEMGGVYGVHVSGSVDRRPHAESSIEIDFGCAPENVDKLKQAVLDEIAAIQKDGVDADLTGKMKEARKRSHETAVTENGFWMGELVEAYNLGDDPKQILEFDPWVEKITPARIQAAAKKYLKPTELLMGVLRPGK